MRSWPGIVVRLWQRALGEHSTSSEIGWSVAVGVFSGCTPFLGFHLGIALALATVFRLNRLWAALGSRVSFTPLLAIIAFGEIEIAHRLRTRDWVRFSPRDSLAHGRELLGDWLLGACLIGGALAGALGSVAYVAARWREAKRARDAAEPPEPPPSWPTR